MVQSQTPWLHSLDVSTHFVSGWPAGSGSLTKSLRPDAAPFTKMDALVALDWSWRPGGFLASHWPLVHVAKPQKLGSNVS